MYIRKTKDIAVLQGNYGSRWEDISYYDIPTERKDLKGDLKAYNENEPQFPHRVIYRRERIKKEETYSNPDE